MTLTDVRRDVPYGTQAGACSLKVPLEANPEGDVLEGRFNVPKRLAYSAPHTNERHEFDLLVRQNFRRWTEWRAQSGWNYVPQSLQMEGPYEIPTPSSEVASDDEQRMFIFLARFKRSDYLYVGLDDFLELDERARRYGVEPSKLPWNLDGKEDTGWVDPMEHAKERRKALGIKREEFLTGPLWEPR